MVRDILIKKAFEGLENAYAPYSGYRIGACVLCKDGRSFLGANIENASYGATNCAERTALFAAYAEGYRQQDITAIAIVSETNRIASPCGICRQVLSELLSEETPIYLASKREVKITNIRELLPFSFGKEDLMK